jgi:hypothetical protein
MTLVSVTSIGRLITFGCSSMRSIASPLDAGSGRDLKTGLRRLTKSSTRSAATCVSRNARVGGSFVMSRSTTSIPRSARKLLAFLQVVQVGLQ